MATKKEHYDRGLTLFGKGKHVEALEEYENALGIDPNDAEIYMAVSMSYQQLQDYQRALDAAKKAVELQPREPLFYTNLSRVFVKLGMIPEAEEAMAMSRQLSMGF